MVNIVDLYATQRQLKREYQIQSMIEYLLSGGRFDESLIELIMLSDERIVINNGHHRVTAVYRSGRSFLHDNEYILNYDDNYKRNIYKPITEIWYCKTGE